ncbi:cyclase family protein [Salipiger pacificus]|nr:cyclase family protein [Alloyangia pacifica]MCA0943955.1 cyclase family protein [Alloyangia pacifica]
MSRRIIDLSVTLTDQVPAHPRGMGPSIEYMQHAGGASGYERIFGVPVAHQLDCAGAAVERLTLTTHNGTHLDAPWHYHPTMNKGERAITIDEVPLEWCMGPGVKLDFRHLPDGHVVSAAEIEAEFARIGHALQPRDIVLVNTRAGALYGQPGHVAAGCGIGREATLWLSERGMKVCGTDAWSWDAPLKAVAEKAKGPAALALPPRQAISVAPTMPLTGPADCLLAENGRTVPQYAGCICPG